MDRDVVQVERKRTSFRRFFGAGGRFVGGFLMEAIDGSNLSENRWTRRGQITLLVAAFLGGVFAWYLALTGQMS